MTGDIRRQLVEAGRRLTGLGLSPGSSGNLSVRDGDTMLMSPTGATLDALDPAALSVVGLDGAHIDGPPPSKEHPLHSAFYRRDGRARAVVHLHSVHAVAASLLPPWSERSAIAPLTPYFVMRVGQTPLVPYAHPGDPGQAERILASPLAFRAVLLQSHGPVTSGTSMADAVDAAIELEEVSRIALLTAGAPATPLPESAAAELAERYGSVWDGQRS